MNGSGGSRSNGNGGSRSSSSSLLPRPPAPPLSLLFDFVFRGIPCILLCILNILMKRNGYPKYVI